MTTEKNIETTLNEFLTTYPQWKGLVKIVYGASAHYGNLTEYLNCYNEFENAEAFHHSPYDTGNDGLLFEGNESDIEKISEIAKKEPYFYNGNFSIDKYLVYPNGFISFALENFVDSDILFNREFVKKI